MSQPTPATKIRQWAIENPKKAAALGISGLAFATPGLIAAPGLAIAGFGSGGVGAATMAAAWQATIGNVVAGSLFATLTSAGAGGAGAAAVGSAVSAGGATGMMGVFSKILWDKAKEKPSGSGWWGKKSE